MVALFKAASEKDKDFDPEASTLSPKRKTLDPES